MLLNEFDEVLVTQRISKDFHNDRWHFPGGHLEFGETFEECSQRECLEETGDDIPIDDFKFLAITNCRNIPNGYHYVTIVTGSHKFLINKMQFASVKKDKIKGSNMEPEKHKDWQWIPWSQFIQFPVDQLFTPYDPFFQQGFKDLDLIKR